ADMQACLGHPGSAERSGRNRWDPFTARCRLFRLVPRWGGLHITVTLALLVVMGNAGARYRPAVAEQRRARTQFGPQRRDVRFLPAGNASPSANCGASLAASFVCMRPIGC